MQQICPYQLANLGLIIRAHRNVEETSLFFIQACFFSNNEDFLACIIVLLSEGEISTIVFAKLIASFKSVADIDG